MRKTFFYINTNIVTKKWGEQNARNNFSRNTLIARAKNVWEKIVGKSAKYVFLYSHKYRYKIWGGKTRETIFQKHKNSAIKNVVKKIVGKKCEKRFFIFTRIS